MLEEETLSALININGEKLSAAERIILEIELFLQICKALNEFYFEQRQEYFRLIKLDIKKEEHMLHANLLRYIVNDILVTEEYSLAGIALYTQTPEDVIYDIAAGRNQGPSLPLSRKILSLHRSVRPELYQKLIAKIIESYSKQPDKA